MIYKNHSTHYICHKKMINKSTNKTFKIISSLLAFFLWGSWAYLINQNIISAFAQGTASFIITLFLIYFTTWLYQILPKTFLQPILPTLITISCTSSILFVIHFLVGTEEIFYTIFPPITVASIFCLYVTFKLQKTNF